MPTLQAHSATYERGDGSLFCVPDVVPAVSAKAAKGTGGPSGDECQNLVGALRVGGREQGAGSSSDNSPIVASPLRSHPFPGSAMEGATVGVRRLTPRECERLQGFPDDWTRWTAAGREIADTHRYQMLGNAVPTTLVRSLGRRLPVGP